MSVQYCQYVQTIYVSDQYGNCYHCATYLIPIYPEPQISSIALQVHVSSTPQVAIDARIDPSCTKACGITLAELRQKVYDISASFFTFFNSQFDALNVDSLSPPLEIMWDQTKSVWIGQNIHGEKECIFPSKDIFAALPEIIAHESMHRIIDLLHPLSHEGQPGVLYNHFADIMTLAFKAFYYQKTILDWKVANRDFTERVHMNSYEPDLENTIVSSNSRIPNHAFYLLFLEINDMVSIVSIWLTALKQLKTQNPTLATFAKQTISAADLLISKKKIQNCWKRVGVRVTPHPNTSQTNKPLKKISQQNSNS